MAVSTFIIRPESEQIRSHWVKPATSGTAPRLPWPQDKLNDETQFFEPLWQLVKKHSGPLCYTRSTTSNLDYGGWFNYFFEQAKECASADAEIGLLIGRIVSLMFDLKVVGTGRSAKLVFAEDFPLALKSTFYGLLERTPRAVPKAILSYLFEMGFEEATTTTAGDYLSQNLALQSNMTDGVAVRSSKGEIVFGYRGDTRDLPAIIKQGARCRAELDFWRKNSGVDQPWHPWNDVDQKWEKMWFRKGCKDNDYFTMNSLAKEFHISCAYPMFRPFEIDQRLQGPASGWDATMRRLAEAKKVTIATVFDKKTSQWVEAPCDETRVFACAIASKRTIARTFELANYPESAVRDVNIEDMVAWLRVRRYHHPPNWQEDPFYDSTRVSPSMTIKVMAWGWVRSEDETRASLGCTTGGIKVVGAKLQNLVGKIFDISHTAYFPDASYDVTRSKPTAPTAPVKPSEPKPVRLTAR